MTSPLDTVPLSPTKRLLQEPDPVAAAPVENTSSLVSQASSALLPQLASWLPKTLVALDKIMDVIPLGSTANNLIDIGIKHFVLKDIDPSESSFREYIEYLNQKDTSKCVVYGIPFLGNVVKIGTVIHDTLEEHNAPRPQISYNLPPSPEELFGSRESFSTIGDRLDQRQNEEGFVIQEHGRIYDPEIYHNFTTKTI
jgi:hypothetical protein